jgi:hypothetical protein
VHLLSSKPRRRKGGGVKRGSASHSCSFSCFDVQPVPVRRPAPWPPRLLLLLLL